MGVSTKEPEEKHYRKSPKSKRMNENNFLIQFSLEFSKKQYLYNTNKYDLRNVNDYSFRQIISHDTMRF